MMNAVWFDKRKQLICKTRSFVLALLILLIVAVFCKPDMVKAVTPVCESYYGSNAGAQDYSKSAYPVDSYLVPLSDGKLMRVQWVEGISKVVVEYYNSDYDLLSLKEISAELPIFGGFTEFGGYYYVCSGQSNADASSTKEVYRVTKYTADWKRVGSVSLYGANTTEPFSFGSCRMTGVGKYLIVRTCHRMFPSSDGNCHQANVTIEIDTEKMAVTDSFYGVLNTSVGYVSHSFNQFVLMDGNNIVAVDHGDAYPRSIALYKYSSNASSGTFYGQNVKTITLLDIYGSIGNNTTNASVGGLEISDSSYLVVGNSIIQDGNSRSTRNVFITSTGRSDSSTDNTGFRWLTNYSEGETGASTPQIVKISGNSFLVLWSRNNKVYYVMVDGAGNTQGSVKSLDGCLSDCKPVVYNSKVVWYTWVNETITFYEIPTSDLTGKAIEIVNGHVFDESNVTVDSKGIASIYCRRCNTISKVNVPVSLNLYFRDKETRKRSSDYWSYHAADYECGDSVEIMCKYSVGAQDPSIRSYYDFEFSVDNPSAVEITDISVGSTKMIKVTLKRAVTTNITVSSKYNPNIKTVVKMTAAHPEPEKTLNIIKQPQNAVVEDGKLSDFSVYAEGVGLQYLWQYKKKGETGWTDWTTKTKAAITVAYDKSRDGMSLRCKLTDANGNILYSDVVTLTYKVAVKITKQPVNASVEEGMLAEFSVAATGNKVTYLWQYKKENDTTWTDWTTKTTAAITVAYEKSRNRMRLRCRLRDSSGNIAYSDEVTLLYVSSAPIIQKQSADTTVSAGTLASFSVTATSSRKLSYLWQYKKKGENSWTDWTTKTTATITVAYEKSRDGMSLRCIVKDDTGKSSTTKAAILTYNSVPVITRQPVSATVNTRELASYSLAATGTELTYLWQYKKAGETLWTNWTTKTKAAITVAYEKSRDGMSLRCRIKDGNGNTVYTDVVKLKYIK